MKLNFRIDLEDNLEKTLAAGRYAAFWSEQYQAINASFYKHTGLQFQQQRISVHIREDGHSKAGSRHRPMELSMAYYDRAEVGCTLIHELAHRLVIGNGVELLEGSPYQDSHYTYLVHRHIYLFLYDVYVDILGKEVADQEVKRESRDHDAYAKAWEWALAMNYDERHAKFIKLKQSYMRSGRAG